MRKWWLWILLLAAVIGGSWWFWSLGVIPASPVSRTVVRADSDTVEVRRAADGVWTAVHGSVEVAAGDSVRTGPNGQATISVNGSGESRLGQLSEALIEDIPRGPIQSAPFIFHLKLVSGRVWTRALRLLDLDDAVSVRTDTVVATVRGTAFDLRTSTTGTTLWVSDAAVEVNGSGQTAAVSTDTPLVLSEGYMANFDASGKVISSGAITEDARQGDWFSRNAARDTIFLRQSQEDRLVRLASLHGAEPDSFIDGIVRVSERLHLAVDPEHAPEKSAAYAIRRFYAIKLLIDEGKSGQALQDLSQLEEELNVRLGGSDGAILRGAFRRPFHDLILLLQDVGPASPLYRLKQRLEDMNVKLSSSDPLASAYARLVSIDDRLDEGESLVTQSSLDDAKNALDAARQGLANVERDIDQLPETVSSDSLHAIRGKLNVLKAREANIRIRLATALAPPQRDVTVTQDATTVSSTPAEAPAPTSMSTVVATSTSSEIVRISLSAQPNPAFVGDRVDLSVIGFHADGSTEDVTARSRFSLSDALGVLNGPVLDASSAGTALITATLNIGSATLRSTVSLEIKTHVIVALSSIEIVPVGVTTVASKQRVPLSVLATYSDGSSKNVTAQTTFISSSSEVGTMVGSTFVAGTAGTVTVTGLFSDVAGKATATINFTVLP